MLADKEGETSVWWNSQEPANSTDSPKTLELALSWIQDCVSTHAECSRPMLEMRLPTRLLELNQPSRGSIRLRESSTFPKKPRYVTLSHCWGNTKHILLTSATCRALSDGIPITSLARNFRDAMQIAEFLGFQFIWIDSLCIMQDSLQDWQHEASTMGDVYKGSSCNIAATASSDGSGGCFRDRDPRYLKPCLVTTEFSNHSNSAYWLESRRLPHDTFQPLFDRGWVVQERVLAPRTLHFGSEYLLWECQRDRKTELYPHGYPRYTSPLPSLTMGPSKYLSKREARSYWKELIREYSLCQLTEPRDKLVAISAIAKELNTLGGWGDYLAGLWRSDILHDLLWVSTAESKGSGTKAGTRSRPDVYRAPSWSWASIDGPIDWAKFPLIPPKRTDGGDMYVAFKSATIDHATCDLYGDVRRAEICLAGPLRRIFLTEKGNELFEKYKVAVLSNGKQSFTFGSPSREANLDGTAAKPDYNIYFDVWGPKLERNDHIHCLIFCQEHDGKDYIWWSLLLEPTWAKKGQFRRIGILHLYSKFESSPWMTEGDPALSHDRDLESETDQSFDSLEYESFDGKNYTISIV